MSDNLKKIINFVNSFHTHLICFDEQNMFYTWGPLENLLKTDSKVLKNASKYLLARPPPVIDVALVNMRLENYDNLVSEVSKIGNSTDEDNIYQDFESRKLWLVHLFSQFIADLKFRDNLPKQKSMLYKLNSSHFGTILDYGEVVAVWAGLTVFYPV